MNKYSNEEKALKNIGDQLGSGIDNQIKVDLKNVKDLSQVQSKKILIAEKDILFISRELSKTYNQSYLLLKKNRGDVENVLQEFLELN